LQDGTPAPRVEAIDTAGREAFHTDGGRIVYGGGGIVPDIIVQEDTLSSTERAFFEIASAAGNKYTDVIFRYAVAYVRSHPDMNPNFVITPEMETELLAMFREAGMAVEWEQLVGARRLIDRHVGSEIARARWGQEGQLQRSNRDDKVVQAAIELLRQASSTEALISMSQGAATTP
jgi:carboxyl-terminal processing protease